MACIEQSNRNNFVTFFKVSGSLTLAELQANGIPDICNEFGIEAPKNLQGIVTSNGTIILTWEDVEGELEYEIQRSSNPNSGFSTIATVGYNQEQHIDTSLDIYNTVYYRVRANSETINGQWSNVASVAVNAFQSGWTTTNTGDSNNDQISLPLESDGTYNFTVYWGDGTSDLITAYNQSEVTHTYAATGSYNVGIKGTIYGWNFSNTASSDPAKITSISNWDSIRLGNNEEYFSQATNLVITADGTLDMTGTTSLSLAFRDCESLTSFPAIDTSLVTNFDQAWLGCHLLTSFPSIDITGATTMTGAWLSCDGLTSFPLLDFSGYTDLTSCWFGCSALTSFPTIDTSLCETFVSTWRNCSALTSFPSINTGAGTDFSDTWNNCDGLTSFPALDFSSGVTFSSTWDGCDGLTSFPSVDVSSGESFDFCWNNCDALASFPALNMSSATDASSAWRNCVALESFGAITITSMLDLSNAWEGCSDLLSFPDIDTSSVTTFNSSWRDCGAILDFDQSLDVSSQDISPNGVSINTDGTELFMVGSGGDSVYRYTMSTAYDLSTASFIHALDVSSEDPNPFGVSINEDGTELYVVGASNDEVYRYTLSTPYNLTTATYIDALDVSSQDTTPNGVSINEDGTELYVSGTVSQSVHRYTMSTPYDLSTASFIHSLDVSSQDATPSDVSINDDGTELFVSGLSGDSVYRYTLSTAYNLTTATYIQALDVSNHETSVTGVSINIDGTEIYTSGTDNDSVYRYRLSTPYDLSTSNAGFPALDFGSMTDGSNCFNGTDIGTSSWSQILIDTETNNQNNNVSFHGGDATYSAGAAATARADLIADHSWSITDGGPA